MTKGREGTSRERVVAKQKPFFATPVDESIALSFVISTEAQRSGEICGFCGPSPGSVFLHSQAAVSSEARARFVRLVLSMKNPVAVIAAT